MKTEQYEISILIKDDIDGVMDVLNDMIRLLADNGCASNIDNLTVRGPKYNVLFTMYAHENLRTLINAEANAPAPEVDVDEEPIVNETPE